MSVKNTKSAVGAGSNTCVGCTLLDKGIDGKPVCSVLNVDTTKIEGTCDLFANDGCSSCNYRTSDLLTCKDKQACICSYDKPIYVEVQKTCPLYVKKSTP